MFLLYFIFCYICFIFIALNTYGLLGLLLGSGILARIKIRIKIIYRLLHPLIYIIDKLYFIMLHISKKYFKYQLREISNHQLVLPIPKYQVNHGSLRWIQAERLLKIYCPEYKSKYSTYLLT